MDRAVDVDMRVDEIIRAAEELPVAIWMGEVPSGAVVYTNRAFRQVLGIEPPEGAARGAFVEPYGVHTVTGEPYPESRMPYERVIAQRSEVVVDDLVIHRRDGRRVHLRVFAKPLFDESGTITHVLEAFTDITREVEAERARAEGEQRLARAQRLESIGQLAAGIAHDFNNLLTVTKLVVARLLSSERDAERSEMLGQVDAVTDSAVALVKNLLGFASRRKHIPLALALDDMVASVVSLASRTFDRRVEVRLDLAGVRDPASPLVVLGDASELTQVVMNLLVNARDAIVGSGTVVVRTRALELAEGEGGAPAAGRWLVIDVEDTGGGIEEAIRDRVFEPYFTTKTLGAIKGTGLGLATVHGIVRRHGGFVTILTTSPQGTTMRVGLPPASTDARASLLGAITAASTRGSVTGSEELPRGNGELVLVVDDEPLVRSSAAGTLRSLGYDVVEANGGGQALAIVGERGEAISVVLLDMVMPGMDGKDVYRALRAQGRTMPVVLSTGCVEDEDARELVVEGASEWLPKPYDVAKLARLLARLVNAS